MTSCLCHRRDPGNLRLLWEVHILGDLQVEPSDLWRLGGMLR
jgi:hypothetical protein